MSEVPIKKLIGEWWLSPMPWSEAIGTKETSEIVAADLISYLRFHGYVIVALPGYGEGPD